MKKLLTIVGFGLVFCMTVDAANAQWRRHGRQRRAGGEIMFGGGLNMCMESGEANCDNADPSFAFIVAPGFRLSPIIGFYVDATYGWLKDDSKTDDGKRRDATITTASVMPTLRLFARMPASELFFGVGAGYAYWATENGKKYAWDNLLNMKLNVGGTFNVAPTMGIGVNVDYIFTHNGQGEMCESGGGDPKSCYDVDGDTDLADNLQLSVFAKFFF